MARQFNGLTPAEHERIALLMEEMGEAIQVCGKILRHGYLNHHPDNPDEFNRMLLEKELGDVAYAVWLMCDNKDVDQEAINSRMMAKGQSIGKYLHHQR